MHLPCGKASNKPREKHKHKSPVKSLKTNKFAKALMKPSVLARDLLKSARKPFHKIGSVVEKA